MADDWVEGLFVGLFTDEEMKAFERDVAAGKAYRSYEGGGGFMGLAKARRVPSPQAERL